MQKIIVLLILIILCTSGCGLPKEKEISKLIHDGKRYTSEESWDQAWDKATSVSDYTQLISYKYDKQMIKKLDKHLDELEKELVIMDKEKSEKSWQKIKKTWDELISKTTN